MQNHLQVEPVILGSEKDLKNYFASHAKPACMHRVGLEAEFLLVDRRTGKAARYSGKGGVESILSSMACMHFYHPVKQHGHIIALNRKDLSVSLEPGGQIELSAPPVSTIFQVDEQLKAFLAQLKLAEKKFPKVMFLSAGIQPFSKLDEIEWTPKERYKIMRRRLPENGALSQWMMKMTATNQANFDYADEDDASQKMKTALYATPVAAALFANSCFSEGGVNRFQSFRMGIWRETDRTRSGFLTQFLHSRSIFKDYLNYALDVPLLFVIRKNNYIEVRGRTFRQFIRKGYDGEKATLADFELHLTVLFPDVRLKQYLEVRCVDAQASNRISAVVAFWKGLLYSESSRGEVLKRFKKITEESLHSAYAEMPRKGLHTMLAGKPLAYWARILTEVAMHGLSEQKTSFEKRNESVFLKPLMTDLKKENSPASFLIKKIAEAGKRPFQNHFWILNKLRI